MSIPRGQRGQNVERLNDIKALAHETMRLKPVAPLIFLETIEDVEIGGVAVPKQTAVMLLTLHGGLQETHFVRHAGARRAANPRGTAAGRRIEKAEISEQR